MNLTDIRQEIRTALVTTGLYVEVRAPESVQPPAAILGAPTITYDAAFGSSVTVIEWPVYIVVAKAGDGSVDQLDPYLATTGSSSVKAALEAWSATSWNDVAVTGVDEYGAVNVGGVDMMGARLDLTFYAT